MSDLVCGEGRVCSLGEQMDALNGNPGKKFPYSAAIVPRRTRTFPVVFAPIPLFLHFTWFECFFFFGRPSHVDVELTTPTCYSRPCRTLIKQP